MNIFFSLLIFLTTSIANCETTSAVEDQNFSCSNDAALLRGNKHCIQALDVSVDYKTPFTITLKKGDKVVGEVFVKSETLDDGTVRLQLAHQCKGKQKTKWQEFSGVCGYQKSVLDRNLPATKEIREEIRKKYNLNEKTQQAEIDAHMAKEINPWIADPQANIEEKNGLVTIKILKEADGTTCKSPQSLTYKTNCK